MQELKLNCAYKGQLDLDGMESEQIEAFWVSSL